MGMFEYKKTMKAVNGVQNSVGNGVLSTQALQVLMELQLFGSSGLLDTSSSVGDATLSGLLTDEGFRSLMYSDYNLLSYFLKLCTEKNMLYTFLRHGLDMDAPETITGVTKLIADTELNCEFFDKMEERAKNPFETLVANKLSWFPYYSSLPRKRSSFAIFSGATSEIPAPARGIMNCLNFYKCTDGNTDNVEYAVEDFNALGITVDVVIKVGKEKTLEFTLESGSPLFEEGSLDINFFRCLTDDITIEIKDPAQAEMLYTEHNLYPVIIYMGVSRGEFV